MKPARKPASSRPKPRAPLKKSHESCPFAARCWSVKRGQRSAFPLAISRFAPLVLEHSGLGLSPGLSTIKLPSVLTESGAYPPDRGLSGSSRQTVLPDSRVSLSPEGLQIETRKRRAPGNTPQPTIIPPPRLNRPTESRRQPVGCISRA